MKYILVSMRDSKVGFMPPQSDVNETHAIRSFSYAINNNDEMAYSPKDFDLFKVGEFNTDTGEITACMPDNIASGYSVFNEK